MGLACLPQFQRGQRKQRKHQRDYPKPHDHFRFAPAQQFKMMVDGRHAEDALAAHLERTDLQNDGQRLNDENSAYKEEQNLLLDDYRDDTKRSSERQRTHIPHENFSAM